MRTQNRSVEKIRQLMSFSANPCFTMEGYLSKKSIHNNESFVHAIALALW